jgi:flagellar hook assembly protein FlgD
VDEPEAQTQLVLLDVTGRKIRALVDAARPAGDCYVGWDGTDERGRRVSTGVYHLRLENGGVARTRPVEVLR